MVPLVKNIKKGWRQPRLKSIESGGLHQPFRKSFTFSGEGFKEVTGFVTIAFQSGIKPGEAAEEWDNIWGGALDEGKDGCPPFDISLSCSYSYF